MSEAKIQRPLSPHLQVYKLPLTALMSISHRITGVGLITGTLLVTAFLVAAASGEAQYDYVMGLAMSLPGKIVLFLWSAGLYFHMCNGIRHMFWDIGKNFKKADANRSNYYVLIGAFALTVLTWVTVCGRLAG